MKIDYSPVISELIQKDPALAQRISRSDMEDFLLQNHRDFWFMRNMSVGGVGADQQEDREAFLLCRRYCFLTELMLTCPYQAGDIFALASYLQFPSRKKEIVYTINDKKLVYCVLTVYKKNGSWVAIDTGAGEIIGYYQGRAHTKIRLKPELLQHIDRIVCEAWRLDLDNALQKPVIIPGKGLGIYTIDP